MKIIELIRSGGIKTQEELVAELKKCGFDATQATVSRDIKQLGLIKALSKDGEYQYVKTQLKNTGLTEKLVKILSQSVISLEIVNNMIVVKTLSGTAAAADEAIDTLNFPGIAGTLAGNDVIFVLARNGESADAVYRRIKDLIDR